MIEQKEATEGKAMAIASQKTSGAEAPAVILVRPQADGNVGAVARAMANMGLKRLLLVEPAVELKAQARAMAVKAGYILDGAERWPSLAEALAPFRRVVGTTSSRSRASNQPVLTARAMARELGEAGAQRTTALVFGPEASGLTNEELALCGTLVTIPCAARQPTLNLAQAVLLVTYELYQERARDRMEKEAHGETVPAPTDQVEGLFQQVEEVLREVGFARDGSFEPVLLDLRKLAARGGLTEREVAILRGVCRRTSWRVRNGPGGEEA